MKIFFSLRARLPTGASLTSWVSFPRNSELLWCPAHPSSKSRAQSALCCR